MTTRPRWPQLRVPRLEESVKRAGRPVHRIDQSGQPRHLRRDQQDDCSIAPSTVRPVLFDIKRLSRRPTTVNEARFDWLDDRSAERPEWIAAFLEMKTVWHPIGG